MLINNHLIVQFRPSAVFILSIKMRPVSWHSIHAVLHYLYYIHSICNCIIKWTSYCYGYWKEV